MQTLTLNTFESAFHSHIEAVDLKSGPARVICIIRQMAEDPDFGSENFIRHCLGQETLTTDDVGSLKYKLTDVLSTYFSLIQTAKALDYKRTYFEYKEMVWLYFVAKYLKAVEFEFEHTLLRLDPFVMSVGSGNPLTGKPVFKMPADYVTIQYRKLEELLRRS